MKCSALSGVFSIPAEKPLTASPAVCELVKVHLQAMEMLDKYTQMYMTTSEKHSKYTAFSFCGLSVGRTEKKSCFFLFFCPRHEANTVYCSRSDKQCESKHTGYWKSMTHSGSVSDARTDCSYWNTFRASECCFFCDLITFISLFLTLIF